VKYFDDVRSDEVTYVLVLSISPNETNCGSLIESGGEQSRG
jgi:hypothetical protein